MSPLIGCGLVDVGLGCVTERTSDSFQHCGAILRLGAIFLPDFACP
jgi:hypothetical protein